MGKKQNVLTFYFGRKTPFFEKHFCPNSLLLPFSESKGTPFH